MQYSSNSTMSRKSKAWLFLGIISAMIFYVGWAFYISEPKYVNYQERKNIAPYDLVSYDEYHLSFQDENVKNVNVGIVLQVDSTIALIKTLETFSSDLKEVKIAQHDYRVIGKGTIYHKVNQWVGFNLMLITQIFIGIFAGLLIITQSKLLSDLL